jgi:phosphatidylglycerophosphate synthase
MIIEGARELDRVAPVAVVPTRPVSTASRASVPVLLLATENEAVGARMRVGGLRIVDRAIRQLARLRDAQVIIVDDGSIPLPRHLPANTQRRKLGDADGSAANAIAALTEELGPETVTVGADTVWLQPGRFDKGTRVVDAASRRVANDAVFGDLQRGSDGLVERFVNSRISSRITRLLLAHLPLSPALISLGAGFIALYGALMVATGGPQTIVLGFALLDGYVILDACAGELARVRLHQTAFGAWLDTVVGDFVNVVMILAVGLALWRHGGSYLDMKMALAAAGMTLFYVAVSYRELMRQGEGDVMKLRWWFAYGQTLRGVSGAGSHSIKAVLLLGQRDFVILGALVLAACDQLPIVLLYGLIVAIVRAGGALGQLLTPAWRLRPPV